MSAEPESVALDHTDTSTIKRVPAFKAVGGKVPKPRAAAEPTSPALSLALTPRGLKNQIRDFARMR
jgi:hypothetical protein